MSKEKQKIEVGDWVVIPNSEELGLVVSIFDRFSLAGFNCEVSLPHGIAIYNIDYLIVNNDCFGLKKKDDLHIYVDLLLEKRTPRECLVFLINDLPINKLLKHVALYIGYFEPVPKFVIEKQKPVDTYYDNFVKPIMDRLNKIIADKEEKPTSSITEKITFHEVPKWWESCAEADEEHCACCGDCEDVEITGSEKETPYPDQPFSEMTVRDHMACQIFPHVAKINKIDKTDDMAAFVEHIHEIVDLMLKNKGSK